MNNFLHNLSLVLAHSVQYEMRLNEFPESWLFPAYNFDFGGGETETDTRFKRKGLTRHASSIELPSFLSNIIQGNVTNSTVPDSLATSQNNFLSGLLNRDQGAVEGKDKLTENMNINPTTFTGSQSLATQAERDPYSQNFENETSDRYEDTVRQGIAQVSTGPDNVRGGQNRVALAHGEALDKMALNRTDEVRRAQVQDAGIQHQAAQIMAAIEAGRRALVVGSQNQLMQQKLGGEEHGVEAVRSVDARRGINTGNTALAAKELGVQRGETLENLRGRGAQSGSSSQWGVNVLGNCCFIFLEGLNGELPWYVRRGRDVFQTPQRRSGYVSMSKWLVPLMAKHSQIKRLVNFILIKPFLKCGAWFFGEETAKSYWQVYRPYCMLWFKLWDFIGRKEQ